MSGIWLASYVALWILFLILGIVSLSILRNLGIIYESLLSESGWEPPPSDLRAEQPLPDLTLRDVAGNSVNLSEVNGSSAAIAIVSTNCDACAAYLRTVGAGEMELDPLNDSITDLILIGVGDSREVLKLLDESGVSREIPILIDEVGSIRKKWGISRTPARIVVDDQQRIVRQVFGG